MERVIVAVIELVEQLHKLVAPAGLHAEIVDMKVVALIRQWYKCHFSLLPGTGLPIATHEEATEAIPWARRRLPGCVSGTLISAIGSVEVFDTVEHLLELIPIGSAAASTLWRPTLLRKADCRQNRRNDS